MARQDGYFIADGVFHTDLPVAFSQITDDNFGVSDTVYRTADGQKIVTVQSPQILDYGDYRDYFHRRKIHVQAWKADWGEESLMTVFMAEQLRELYETQKPFWIQYDDEMARCWGRCVGLNADLKDGNAPHVFFTPHYPIFPFGHEPPDDPNTSTAWDDMFMVGRTVWSHGTYDVYPDYGMVVIKAGGRRYNDRIKTHLKYTWRGYVRIRELSLSPFQLAQTYYTGTVVFEQIAVPISGVELEWRDAPYVGICTYYARVRTSTQAKIAVVANVNAIRYGHKVTTAQAVGVIRITPIVESTKNAVSYKYGSTGIPTVVITCPTTGGVHTVVVSSGKGTGGIESSIGTGWARSTAAKTEAEILSDGDDFTYIYGSTYSQRFKLTSFTDPAIDTGHTLTLTWRRGTSVDTTLVVRLLEGKLVRGTGSFTQTVDGDVASSFTLTNGEAQSITDYSNLYVEFYSATQATISAFKVEIPLPGGGTIKERSVVGIITVSPLIIRPSSIGVAHPVIAPITLKIIPNSGIVALVTSPA